MGRQGRRGRQVQGSNEQVKGEFTQIAPDCQRLHKIGLLITLWWK
jgi:hypothetical protein